MGYQSDIVLALDKNVFVDNILGINPLPSILKEADNTHKSLEGTRYYLFERWKWYTGYKEIDEITKFMDNLNDNDYAFIRVGEDLWDIEKRGDTFRFEMYTSTCIHYPDNT